MKAGMLRRAIFLMLSLIFLLFSSYSYAKYEISAEPTMIEAKIPWSKRVMPLRVIRITNTGDEPVKVEIRIFGMSQDKKGNIIYTKGDVSRLASGLIKLGVDKFDLDVKQYKEVGSSVNIPSKFESGGAYALLYIHYIPLNDKNNKGKNLWVPVTIMLPGKEVIKTEVSGLKVYQAGKGNPVYISGTVENSGNIHIFADGELIIKNKTEKTVSTFPIKKKMILPSCSCPMVITLDAKSFPVGDYIAESHIKAGNAKTINSRSFSIMNDFELAQPQVEILDLSVPSTEEKSPVKFQFSILNKGNVDLAGMKGELLIIDSLGKIVNSIPFKSSAVPITASKKYAGYLPKILPIGDYTVKLILDYGVGEEFYSQTKFKITKMVPVIKGEILSFALNYGKSGDVTSFVQVKFGFRNSGNQVFPIKAVIKILDSEKTVVNQQALGGMIIEPGKSKIFATKWNCDLPRGLYEAILEVYFAGKGAAVKTNLAVTP